MSALIAQAKMLEALSEAIRTVPAYNSSGDAALVLASLSLAATRAASDLREQAKQEAIGP